ncbi:uncharacterized protein LOC117505464 [Thalassophryne amazonica]|uniref:uncharacterized protein LOC117505464 n=1 Tax=Thalassophryne amazonica TaxID=390379 RepID=UPI00147201C5|nr:uncharacterized protein LOC117505464 [Thalassophryne amazonica]
MIYWENRDSVDSVGNMSKADILRGIVNEKLATAAREILAVVERTVAGYEEEASGFREEIDRQRRQLEAFQPKVKLERPDLHEYEAFAVHEGKVEQHCQHTALEDTRTLSFDRQQEGDDDEEERLALSFSQIQDMDYPSPSRGLSDMATGRCVLAEDMDHLVLRVRMLEDSQTTVLSNSVFMKAPLLEVQCPRGLKEAEFVDLLRSTFPQLARGKIFDIFTTDRSKKLQPLKLKTLTPEEIDRSIRSTGAGRSALYIRLKTGDTLQSSSGEIGLLQRDKDAANNCPASAAVAAAHQTPSCAVDQSERRRGRRGLRVSTLKDSQCSVLSKYGVEDVERPGLLCGEDGEEQGEEEMSAAQYAQSQDDPNDVDYQVPSRSLFSRGSFEKRKFSKSQFSDAGTHLYLRIRLLEDPQALVVSNTVLKRSFLQEVQCPLGMQEVEFLELLRSTFPQLAGGEPFDVFITDKTKKLKPLSLKTLTPEAINTYIRSSGGGNSALYIKLKVGQDLLNSRKHLHLHRGDGIADHCPKTAAGVTTGETKTYTVDPLQTMGDRLVERRYRVLRMCMLQDYQGDVLSKNVFMKSPVQKVKCTHGLQESDFLVMLKSIFPQMTEDKNHFDMFRADKKRKLHRLKLKTLTPDTVYKCLKTFGSKKSTLYFRMKKYQLGAKALQTGENLQSRNVDSLLQKYGDDTTSRRSTTSVMVTANQNKMCPRDKPLRKRRRRGEEPTHHVLGVCLLQDSQCDVISRFVFMKSPVRKVTCPRGLHEADFLELLRSTFPQLDGDKKSFDIFRTDRTRKLQQLLVKTLTPDEIFNSLKSVGSAKTFYIRLKTEAQAQSSSDKSHLLQKHDATNNYPTTPGYGDN